MRLSHEQIKHCMTRDLKETRINENKKDSKTVVLGINKLTIFDVVNIARYGYLVSIEKSALDKVKKAHEKTLEIAKNNVPVYGINTGFGSLSSVVLNSSESEQLSRNLILSHSVAVGDPMLIEHVRAGIVVRINTLLHGHSGNSVDSVLLLTELLNRYITPVIPSKGSLACSGDLCFLSHVALTISKSNDINDLADNLVLFNNKIYHSSILLNNLGINRIVLGPKEGLALTNGSSFTAGIACLAHYDILKLCKLGITTLSLSLEAMLGNADAYNNQIHNLRFNKGQIYVANSVNTIIKDSQLVNSSNNIQDSYSLRCGAQIQGGLYNALQESETVLTDEINSVTDNPILIEENGDYKFVSGGNFHGQIIGQITDSLKLSLTTLGNVSERRSFKVLDGKANNGLPNMLAENAGLNSGYMMIQYTCASLTLLNKSLSNPDSVNTTPTCASQEDHNSNAYNSVLNLLEIIKNTKIILSLELLLMTVGIFLRLKNKNVKLGKGTETIYNFTKLLINQTNKDHSLQNEILNFTELTDMTFFNECIEKLM